MSDNEEEINRLKLLLQEAYKTGYREGIENGFIHALDIHLKLILDLKKSDEIKKWCDQVIEASEVLKKQ